MSEGFLADLDAYFCKNYSNFDLICALPSYEPVTVAMLLRSGNRVTEGENGVSERRKLCYQPQCEKLLQEFKERFVDGSFTYSFRVAPARERFAALFRRRSRGGALLLKTIASYGEDAASVPEKLGVSAYVWKKIVRGSFLPEKVLLFKLCLLLGVRQKESLALLKTFGAYYDFADARDVVVRYLIDYRVFNRDMIDAAFEAFNLNKIL